jgi:hypothetical protein
MEDSAGAFLSEAPCRLWLPGLGEVDPRVRRVVHAVRDYDPDLKLARHEVTGDWVVVLREDGHPIFGFGRDLPSPDEVAAKLAKHDIKRHGKKIMDQLARATERQRLQDQYAVDEGDGATAEAMAQFYAKHGARKATRIFVPRGVS